VSYRTIDTKKNIFMTTVESNNGNS
jgi:hypothetical protein